jgi:hypothetical protein
MPPNMPSHTATRRTSGKRRSSTPPPAHPPAPPPVDLSAFTDEWWSSWRRASALGWDYLNAVSGLMRLNLNAFTRTSLFPPFMSQSH